MRPSGPTSPHPIPGSRSFSCSPISSRRWSDWRSSPHGGDAASERVPPEDASPDSLPRSASHGSVRRYQGDEHEDAGRRSGSDVSVPYYARPTSASRGPRSSPTDSARVLIPRSIRRGHTASRGRVDRDRSRRHELRGRQESVAGHGCHDLAGRRTPAQMPTPVQRCRQEQREIGCAVAVCDHLRRSRRQISAMAGAGFHLSQ